MSKEISKILSYALRHKPESLGLNLDKNGWVSVEELFSRLLIVKKISLNQLELDNIVQTNDKKRFSYNEDKTKIRANQGHSIDIDLELTQKTPPEILYHGTAEKNFESILKSGINKGSRHHVHLSQDIETAKSVGSRHGKPIILKINTRLMMSLGYKFYQSNNNVWLVDFIPNNAFEQWIL